MSENTLAPYAPSDLPSDLHILVLAPHPDDEVFGCGGAIALHSQAGADVHVVLVTSGDAGGGAEERIQESRQASKILGYQSLLCWNLPDRGVVYCDALIQRIEQFIQERSITLVYAPSLWENHPDHRAVALGAIEAVRRVPTCALMQYEVSAPLRPNYLIDITTVESKKNDAMQCFISQLQHQRYDKHIQSLNHYRTYTLPKNIHSAEGFEYYASSSLGIGEHSFFQSEFQRQKEGGMRDIALHKPLVSVLIRSMNIPYLQTALNSVGMQTYPHIEIIVINASGKPHQPLNASIGTVEIRFVDSNVPLLRSKAANIALDNANGVYALFLDDDDWIDPIHIEKLVHVLQEENNAILSYTGTRVLNEKGSELGFFDYSYTKNQIYAGNFIPIHSVLFYMEAHRTHGCRFDEALDIYEDWDFWIQLAQYGEFKSIKGISANYRMEHGGSSDAHNPPINKAARLAILIKWQHLWNSDVITFLADEAVRARNVDSLLQEKNALIQEKNLLSHSLQQILDSRSWKLVKILRDTNRYLSNIKIILKRFKSRFTHIYSNFIRRFEKGSLQNGTILSQTEFISRGGNKLCFFSHYDRNNIIDPYVVYYLESLLLQSCDIVFISTAENLSEHEISKIANICAQIIVKENIGYDFGAWKTAMDLCHTRLESYAHLIICNDSVYAPLFNLETMFNTMGRRKLDMWGITESYDMRYHLQSYFLVFEKSILKNPKFSAFWSGYKVFRHKRNIIENYEIGLSRLMAKEKYTIGAYCPCPPKMPSKANITHQDWKNLIIEQQCPIIKIELLRDNPMQCDLKDVKNIISEHTSYPLPLILSYLQRLEPSSEHGLLRY